MRPTFNKKSKPGTYNVSIPFSGYVTITVDEAESEQDAVDQAWQALGEMSREEVEDATSEVEFHDIICEGNVFHGCSNEIEVQFEG